MATVTQPGANVTGQAHITSEDVTARRIKFPTALTVLAIVLLGVWIASFLIPSGVYETDPDTGGPVPGTYRELRLP